MNEAVRTSQMNGASSSSRAANMSEGKEEEDEEDLSEYPCAMIFLNPSTVNIPDLEEITRCTLFHVDASVTTREGEVIQLFCHIYGLEKALKAL
jgi:hypothetical protein